MSISNLKTEVNLSSEANTVKIDQNSGNNVVRSEVRGTASSIFQTRVNDRFNHEETTVSSNSFQTMYSSTIPTLMIQVKKIFITVSVSGSYTIQFRNNDGSSRTTIIKSYLTANQLYQLDFEYSVKSPYIAGSVIVYNYSGSSSVIQTTILGWEE